jgi:twitching motility protein PilI
MNQEADFSIKYRNKFQPLLQDIHSSSLLAKQNSDEIKTAEIRHGFTLGSLALLIPKGVICEVIQANTLYPLPNTPHWFSGFVNHRGEALPVFYLEKLFNLNLVEPKDKQWILFLQQPQKTCGVLINHCPYKLDNLVEIAITEDLIVPSLINPYVERAFYDGKREWLDFSYHPFFLSLKSAF